MKNFFIRKTTQTIMTSTLECTMYDPLQKMCSADVLHLFHPEVSNTPPKGTLLLTSKKWRLHKKGRQSRRPSIEMKLDWLFNKPRSYYWLRVAASNLASQSACLAAVTQSHCNPQ